MTFFLQNKKVLLHDCKRHIASSICLGRGGKGRWEGDTPCSGPCQGERVVLAEEGEEGYPILGPEVPPTPGKDPGPEIGVPLRSPRKGLGPEAWEGTWDQGPRGNPSTGGQIQKGLFILLVIQFITPSHNCFWYNYLVLV